MYNEISPHNYSSPLSLLPHTPSDQQEAIQQEREQTLAQLPLLKQVIGRLDKRIEATDSVKEALKLADRYKVSRETALIILDVVRAQLETERGYIANRVSRAKR